MAEGGCGTGRVATHLAGLGLRVVGLDHAPEMVVQARLAHPDLPLVAADARALPLRSGSVAGLVAWYSLIALTADQLAAALADSARVLPPGAPVLVAFQSGNGERVERTTSYGLPVPLTYVRHRVDDVVRAVERAGLALCPTVVREPWSDHEATPQAPVLAARR